MKATISIKFLSEREVEERTFTRKTKPYDQFSPLRTKIHKKKISDNSLTLAIKTGKDERHFAAWEYGGNFKFWSHDPSGYLMSVHFSQPDEELMKEIGKVLRRIRKFYILPGNFTLSCHISQLSPTYPEAERILKDSCNAIKSELDPIAEVNIEYDLSTTDDQEPQFYSKKEFLRPKADAESEPPPVESLRGPTKIERREYDPKYSEKNESIEPEPEKPDYTKPEYRTKRDYVEPKYPQYSKDYYKKLQKPRYKKKSFSKAIAVMMGLSILVMGGIVYGIEQGYIHLDLPKINPEPDTKNQQPPASKVNPPTVEPENILSSCTMASNGLGDVRINCLNHDTISCNTDPSFGSGIQKDVTLTVKGTECNVKYQNAQGATIYRNMILASPSTSNTNNISPSPQAQTPVQPPPNSNNDYSNSIAPCEINSDDSGNVVVDCYSQGSYHFVNPELKNLSFYEARLAWNNSGEYELIQYHGLNDAAEYNLGKVIQKESTDNANTVSSGGQSPIVTLQPTNAELYQYALNLVNDDRKAKGLNPVALSNTQSAQNHADDQLSLRYFSHWNSDGVKPYVVYTKLGGKGHVAENNYYTYSYCPTSNCVENTYDPYKEIKKGEDEMMNNDASSNWGHRDNILEPHHTHVNFGIAYDHERLYFVENFEDNLVNWQIAKLVGSKLTMVGTIQQGYSMDHIDVFSDPKPKTLSEQDLDNQPPYNAGYYDQGNNVGIIVPQLSGNYYYPECSPDKITITLSDGGSQCIDYVTYENNSANPNAINVAVDVSKWTNSDGLHTVYVIFKDSDENMVHATSLTLEYLK